MLKQERARITRNNIVESAARSFNLHGFGKTSLSDIIEEAGVTKGALYFHFESKEDVARAVLDSQLERVTQEFAELRVSDLPPLEMLVRLCVRPIRDYRDATPSDFRLATEIASIQPGLTLPYFAAWLRMISSILDMAVQAGDLKNGVDPDTLARFILSTLTGAQLVSEVLSADGHLERDDREMWDLLFHQTVADDRLASIGQLLTLALARP